MSGYRSYLAWRQPDHSPWRDVTEIVVIYHRDDGEGKRKAMRHVPLGFEWRLQVFAVNACSTKPLRVLWGKRVARPDRRRQHR